MQGKGSLDTSRHELPAGQLEHDVEPSTEEYVPLAHVVQNVDPPSDAVPAAQIFGTWFESREQDINQHDV